jgi:ribosomal protein S19E (S16A)
MKHGTQRIITVKDVPADAFIRAFSQHLKKTQKIEIPKVQASSS